MTAKNLYEAMLIELNKVNAPSLLLEDYNYFINKAVNQYINKRYGIYDINQQTTDDLRVLKATATLKAKKVEQNYGILRDKDALEFFGKGNLFGATYTVDLPDDYLHALNCICVYEVLKPYKCYSQKIWSRPAERLTADAWSTVYDNAYMCPTYRRPYYYIHNVNRSENLPTNEFDEDISGSTDQVAYTNISAYTKVYTLKAEDNENVRYITVGLKDGKYYLTEGTLQLSIELTSDQEGTAVNGLYYNFKSDAIETTANSDNSQFKISSVRISGNEKTEPLGDSWQTTYPRKITLEGGGEIDTVDKTTFSRHVNPTRVRCEIRYGRDDSVFALRYVMMDYIKAPQYIKLTQEQLDLTIDTSQKLEFPDQVCQEIINELVLLILENASDQRLATHPRVSDSIVQPAQQQQPQQRAQQAS